MKVIMLYKSIDYLNKYVLPAIFGIVVGIIGARLLHICIKALNEDDAKLPAKQIRNHIVAIVVCALLYGGFVTLVGSYF